MTITLRPEHEKLIAEAMRTGAFRNPVDVIGHALEMLQSDEEWLQDQKDVIEAKIDRAFEQFEAGQHLSTEDSRSDMQERKAQWLNERRR